VDPHIDERFCPSILPWPGPEAQSACPAGYEIEISNVNGAYFIQCERVTVTSKLLPASTYGAWAFGGLNFMIGWLNDGS
jgi:hypothetical protein